MNSLKASKARQYTENSSYSQRPWPLANAHAGPQVPSSSHAKEERGLGTGACGSGGLLSLWDLHLSLQY